MAFFCECSRTTQVGSLTEKSIAIQNMRVQGFDRVAKDDNGSKEIEARGEATGEGPQYLF